MKAAVDHLGNHYKSESEMCDKYNILPVTFKSRIARGMSLKEALTISTPYGKRREMRDKT